MIESTGISGADETAFGTISARKRRIDTASWAAFFIWIGLAMFANVPWSWFIIGVGAIVLGAETAAWIGKAEVSGFWVVCGLAFVAGGASEMYELNLHLGPALLIVAGVILMWRAFFGRIRPAR